LNHHPALSQFLDAVLTDVDKQIDNARAASLHQKRRRKRRYVIQEQKVMETLMAAQFDEDDDILNVLTLIGLQVQGYVEGLRDNGGHNSDAEDESIAGTSFNTIATHESI
jgi:hypothetical protein